MAQHRSKTPHGREAPVIPIPLKFICSIHNMEIFKKNFYIHIDIDINDHICIQYGTHIQKLCPFRSHISFCFPYRPYPWKVTMSMEPEHHRTPPSSAKPSSPCTAWHAIFGQVDSFWLGPSRGNPGIQNSVFNYMIYKMIYEFHETKHPTC